MRIPKRIPLRQGASARVGLAVGIAALLLGGAVAVAAGVDAPADPSPDPSTAPLYGVGGQKATTPIKHVVVIFQENVSFDHYFATYPKAKNPKDEPQFHAATGTPSVNGLSGALHDANQNAAQPFRLDRSQAATCDQDHDYTAEQQAFDGGLMDKFVESTGTEGGTNSGKPGGVPCKASDVMGYYDGNTATALWNYAQHFAMSDDSFGTTFGPSTPGALNLASGQTHGATPADYSPGGFVDTANGSVIGDPQPTYDDCTTRDNVAMSGKNVGDLLNAAGVTWGWFQGGFRPTTPFNPQTGAKAACGATHTGADGNPKGDYIPHHEPFQYYKSTANPHHLPPTSVAVIGKTDRANHQYDLSDFWQAADTGHLPAVSFLKAAGYQDGHAGYSSPLLEQQFLVNTINHLQSLDQWKSTAVIVAWDDSDGWYDHVMGPIVNQSQDPAHDALLGTSCGTRAPVAGYQDRCGYGPRLPLLVISPWAKQNFVDHTVTDQSSILRFIEDDWNLGRIGDGSYDALAGPLTNMFDFTRSQPDRKLYLHEDSGEPK